MIMKTMHTVTAIHAQINSSYYDDCTLWHLMCYRFRDKLGVKVVKALKRNDDGVTHAAIDMLCALMQVRADSGVISYWLG